MSASEKDRASTEVDATEFSAKAKELSDKAKEAAPDSATEGVQQAQQLAEENPMPLAFAGVFLAGVVFGRLLSR